MKPGTIIALLLLLGTVPIAVEGVNESPASSGETITDAASDWLLLMYMAGDNNLGRDGYEWGNAVKMDIEEMENTMPDTGLDILALADMEGPNNSYLYDLVPAPARGISSPTIPLSDVNPAWTDEVDMSDWRTLRDFLVFSLTNRSADRIMFVLWNHGAGWYSSDSSAAGSRSEEPSRGFALDSNSGGAMFLDEFRDAFISAESELGSLHMDMIGFDTCSMGMMEVYYQISPWFDLAIGSEDEQPWYGYNYTFVSMMGGPNPLGPAGLGSHIIDEFEAQYLLPGEYPYASITLTDLAVLRDELAPGLSTLADHLMARMFHNEVTLNHKFQSVRGRTELLGFENLDLGHFLMNLANSDLQASIRESAASALGPYNDTVMDEWHQPDGRNLKATGISIYLPPDGSYRTDYDGGADFLNLTDDTLWDEMINEYHDPKERVRVSIEVSSIDGDGVKDDVTVTATDPRSGTPIPGAEVYVNGSYLSDTDGLGQLVVMDLYPGAYLFEVYNGSWVGESSVKVLNRAPVPVVTPSDPSIFEGEHLMLDARGSYDPDGDRITFRWDLDHTDGLNDSDSGSAWINRSFPEKGDFTVRLTVNDSELESYLDIVIHVLNAPPKARIDHPSVVDEDQIFTVSAAGSWDSWPDVPDLSYRFNLDNVSVTEWINRSHIEISIPDSGWHLLSVEVMDPEGERAESSGNINVVNVAPVAKITGPGDVIEDQSFLISAGESHDTPSDIGSLRYAWYLDGSEIPISHNMTLDLSFSARGRHALDLLVSDDDDHSDTASFEINVSNIEPVAVITLPGKEGSVWEDQILDIWGNGSLDTPSDLISLNLSWDIDGDMEYERFGPLLQVSWPRSGTYQVHLLVTDDDGEIDSETILVEVLNKPPEPVIMGALEGNEDEPISFGLAPGIDTVSDIEDLAISWEVDGIETGDPSDTFTFTSKFRGTYRLGVIVRDDDGAVGSASVNITIRNPPPQVVLENVPVEVEEGESFTAVGHRSTDNPSDITSLVFEWYLDGVLIGNGTERNITVKEDSPGTHTLRLRVTDDDGDFMEVEAEFEVLRSSLLMRILDRAFSSFVLIVLVVFLLAILIAVYQFARRVRDLPPVQRPEPEENEEQDEDDGSPETRPEDGNGEEAPGGDHYGPGEDVRSLADEHPDDDRGVQLPLPEELMTPVDIPPPPEIEDAMVPDVDGSIFDDPTIPT
ncbi:MAG: PKD domain-containing protein [Thermoplasmatota archaeon]